MSNPMNSRWKFFLFAAVLGACAHDGKAQTLDGSVTFSLQGAHAVQRLTGIRGAGFDLLAYLACAGSSEAVYSGGALYDRVEAQGYAWQSPELVTAELSRRTLLDWHSVLLAILREGTMGGAFLVSSGIISAPAVTLVTGLLAGHGVVDEAEKQFKRYGPTPQLLVEKLLKPTDRLRLPPDNCTDGYIGIEKVGKSARKQLAITIPQLHYDKALAEKIRRYHLQALASIETKEAK